MAQAHRQSVTAYRPQDLVSVPGVGEGDRIPDQVIEARIDTVTYSVLPGTVTTVCTVVLDTGYSVWGACACIEPDAFDPALGEQCAYREALRKLRTLFGFLAVECRYLYKANTWHLRGEEGQQ